MKIAIGDLYQSLKPVRNGFCTVWAYWSNLLPKLPDLSWSFFSFEKGSWFFYQPHKDPVFLKENQISQTLDKTGLWVRVAPWKNTFHHDLKIPFADSSKRRELIPFQIEPLLPFPVDLSEISHMATQADGLIWTCAIQKKDIELIQQQSVQEGLRPDAIVSPLFAVVKAHQNLCKEVTEPVLYTHQEADRLVFILVDHQKVWGLRQVVLVEKSINLSMLELEAKRTLVFLQAAENTQRLWIGSLQDEPQGYSTLNTLSKEAQESFLLIGAKAFVESSSRYDGLIPCKHIPISTKVLPWVRGLTWASGALLVAFCFQAFLDHLSHNREARVFAEKIVAQAHEQEIDLPFLENFSSLKEWAEETEHFIQNKLSPYPLQADLPSPRDTLGWIGDMLSSYPQAHITSFEYKSESFPDSKHIAARYRVKIDLEIQVQDPAVAESIQQKLLKSYEWIERPSALVWKAQKDRYQVSFYLRDKTRYVQK